MWCLDEIKKKKKKIFFFNLGIFISDLGKTPHFRFENRGRNSAPNQPWKIPGISNIINIDVFLAIGWVILHWAANVTGEKMLITICPGRLRIEPHHGSTVSSVGRVPDCLITRLRVQISTGAQCCVLDLSKTFHLHCLVLVQPRKTYRHD